ncbi:hypothetical protein BHM03_00030721 [Ensete ventricosum]|nr:hypothetical protein BHM03_00030721 [Ensete ventricosum]
MLLPQDGVSESQDQGGNCQGNRGNSVLHRGDRADVLQGSRLESSTSSIDGISATAFTAAACYELHLKYLVDGVSCASRRLFLFVVVVPSAIQTRREVSGYLLLHCTDVFPQFPSDRRHELGHGEGPLRLAFEEEAGDRYCDLFVLVLHALFRGVGSVLGSVLVIAGLYSLLWGKNKEARSCAAKAAEGNGENQLQVRLQSV